MFPKTGIVPVRYTFIMSAGYNKHIFMVPMSSLKTDFTVMFLTYLIKHMFQK